MSKIIQFVIYFAFKNNVQLYLMFSSYSINGKMKRMLPAYHFFASFLLPRPPPPTFLINLLDWTNWTDWLNLTDCLDRTDWATWTNWTDWTIWTNWTDWLYWKDWLDWKDWLYKYWKDWLDWTTDVPYSWCLSLEVYSGRFPGFLPGSNSTFYTLYESLQGTVQWLNFTIYQK